MYKIFFHKSSYIYKVCTHVGALIFQYYGWLVIRLWSPIKITISKEQCDAKQDKANACYHQVSCCINFSPGFTWFIHNRKHKWEVAETKGLNNCTSRTLEDAGKTFNCLHS